MRHVPAGNVPQEVVTFAVSCCPAAGKSVSAGGTTAMLRTRSAPTLTVIGTLLLMSARAVAITVHVPVPRNEVKTPVGVTVPHAGGTLQTTVVSDEFCTVAVSVVRSQATALTGVVLAVIVMPLSTVTMACPLTAELAVLVATTVKTPEYPGAV